MIKHFTSPPYRNGYLHRYINTHSTTEYGLFTIITT